MDNHGQYKTLIGSVLLYIPFFCRYMYWASYGTNPKIERAYLDGDNRESYVTDVKKPAYLTIDYDTETLYWYEKEYERIESIDLATGFRRNVSTTNVSDVAGLDVFQGYIYWAE